MGRGSKRNSARRQKGTHDKAPRPHRTGRALPEQKYAFAEYALRHAHKALDALVDIMDNSESDKARVSAAKRILKRAFGEASKSIDTTAIKHTDIVYRTVEEIRRELARRGLPPDIYD